MKRIFIRLSIVTALILAGCGSGDEAHEGEHQHEGSAQPASGTAQREGSGSVTQWTDETELFMEYPEIIVGQEATFAVHLTRLSDFEPIADSEVHFAFRSDEGNQVSVTERQVQVPGIYGPDVTFEHAGRYNLTIEIYGMVNDTLQVQGIPVYNSAEDIPPTTARDDPNLITFLKEQQWDIPFATTEVHSRTLTRTVEAYGEIMPAQSAKAVVAAPFSGTIASGSGGLAVTGRSVSRGESVAQLRPAVQSDGTANFAEQYTQAQSELELAEARLERSERLYEKQAIPEIELKQARIEYRQAQVRFQTISEVVELNEQEGSSQSYRFDLKAPITGTVVKTYVSPGMQVQAGQPLYEIANTSRIWLKAQVPIIKQPLITDAGEAAFRVQGGEQLYRVNELGGGLISRGNAVDNQNRTISLIYEMNNPDRRFPLGVYSTVYIDTEQKSDVLAVPESALIEEEGTYAVFVHVSGESFRKQQVDIGIRDRGWVEITAGLQPSEHVVTRNAYQIKLASLSSEAPSHGHSH